MNRDRRARLTAIAEQLATLREQIEELGNEEQEAHDNLPESIQLGERGGKMEEDAQTLSDAASDLENLIETINGVTEG